MNPDLEDHLFCFFCHCFSMSFRISSTPRIPKRWRPPENLPPPPPLPPFPSSSRGGKPGPLLSSLGDFTLSGVIVIDRVLRVRVWDALAAAAAHLVFKAAARLVYEELCNLAVLSSPFLMLYGKGFSPTMFGPLCLTSASG
ncbi:hypothetical protein V8G54_027740 [Vigna mungo]|uniref:Uncharacterized protein n=1 Tax=Vigna mungo TaxID=3915 RepID=A0AAQ3MQ68_VIGMU